MLNDSADSEIRERYSRDLAKFNAGEITKKQFEIGCPASVGNCLEPSVLKRFEYELITFYENFSMVDRNANVIEAPNGIEKIKNVR